MLGLSELISEHLMNGRRRQDPVPSPALSQRRNTAPESLEGYIVSGCWELERKFQFYNKRGTAEQWIKEGKQAKSGVHPK